MNIRHLYDGLQDKVSHAGGLACPQHAEDLTDEQVGQELITRQADKDSTDINKIVERYEKTGGNLADLIQQGAETSGGLLYGDFANALDFQAAQNLVVHANEQFDALPVKVRNRFQNNPALFLEFATNPDNLEEMRKLGLTKPVSQAGPAPSASQPSGSSGASPAEGAKTPETKAQA